jgi:hypothetical protein
MVCGSRAAEIGGIKRVDFWIEPQTAAMSVSFVNWHEGFDYFRIVPA